MCRQHRPDVAATAARFCRAWIKQKHFGSQERKEQENFSEVDSEKFVLFHRILCPCVRGVRGIVRSCSSIVFCALFLITTKGTRLPRTNPWRHNGIGSQTLAGCQFCFDQSTVRRVVCCLVCFLVRTRWEIVQIVTRGPVTFVTVGSQLCVHVRHQGSLLCSLLSPAHISSL